MCADYCFASRGCLDLVKKRKRFGGALEIDTADRRIRPSRIERGGGGGDRDGSDASTARDEIRIAHTQIVHVEIRPRKSDIKKISSTSRTFVSLSFAAVRIASRLLTYGTGLYTNVEDSCTLNVTGLREDLKLV